MCKPFKQLCIEAKLTKFYIDGCLGFTGRQRQHEIGREAAQVIADTFGNEIVMREEAEKRLTCSE